MNRFCLKQGQGLKASAAHPHVNLPGVHPPPLGIAPELTFCVGCKVLPRGHQLLRGLLLALSEQLPEVSSSPKLTHLLSCLFS